MNRDLDVIKAHYAASDRGDLPGMLAPLAVNVAWTEMAGFPYAGTYIGPDAVRDNVFARIAAEWDGYTATVDEIAGGSDGIVIGIGTYSGTFRATGQAMAARFVHVWRLSNGTVERFEQFTDTAVVQAAMRG
ncbi:nuclear transport factor 2 family protein [Nocardia brasiliensis]|uniref:nuclear transport factor 2 family protein n=1 Tax=Nocardia brasiliensis TaxID=37326 RepID=UPI002458FBB5|nr:nuclear transport factor 2 family protein [Nocardia brasiliensis]